MAPKEKPVTIPAVKIKAWRANCKRLLQKAEPYAVDLDDIEKRVIEIEQKIPEVPPVIQNAADCSTHQQYLRKLCHLRTQLTQIESRCIQTKTVWGHIIKITKSYLWNLPEIHALKNDTARGMITNKVMGHLEWKYVRVSALIEIAEKIVWTLKDNQRAALGMVQTASEERFLYQQGMEK